MNKKTIISLSVLAIAIIGYWYLTLPKSDDKTNLSIHLRCVGDVGGKLTASFTKQEKQVHLLALANIKDACKRGVVEMNGYDDSLSMKFILMENNKKVAELKSEYGEYIHRDENGFYLILKLTHTAPYLANENI